MSWFIPAKTFVLGEYAALTGNPALLVTTTPYFELAMTAKKELQGIHPQSPAGRFWTDAGSDKGLNFTDPYNGLGGMGASSAQFIGAYLASISLSGKPYSQKELMDNYFNYAWSGAGLRPSGYDLLAQLSNGCVYINQNDSLCHSYDWPFSDMAFILLHTGEKLATHHHLQETILPDDITALSRIVKSAKNAFDMASSQALINDVNNYAKMLAQYGLVAEHSKSLLAWLNSQEEVFAAKGCGAMGADVLLLLVQDKACISFCNKLASQGFNILATSNNLYRQSLFANNMAKTLEISH
jgi:mevalonate kinase